MSDLRRHQAFTLIGSVLLLFPWSPLVAAEPSVNRTVNIVIEVLVFGLIAAVVVYVSIRPRRAGRSWKRVALTDLAGVVVAFLITPFLALAFILIHGRTM